MISEKISKYETEVSIINFECNLFIQDVTIEVICDIVETVGSDSDGKYQSVYVVDCTYNKGDDTGHETELEEQFLEANKELIFELIKEEYIK